MMKNWLDRAKAIMDAKGLKDADINRRMSDSGKGTIFTDMKRKGSLPSIEKFAKLADILGTSIGYLYSGAEPASIELPILGVVENKEMWEALSAKDQSTRLLPLFDSDLVAIKVATTEMQPTYRDGDVLVGRRSDGSNLDNLIGRDCIVETKSGERLVKYLARGASAGTYSLRSFDPAVADIENVTILWAAPVQMVVRDFD